MTQVSPLQNLSLDLHRMADAAVSDRRIDDADVRRLLRFVSRVVQLVDQAFENVYATFVELRYLPADPTEAQLNELRKELDLLVSRQYYHETEAICNRLRALGEQYRDQIEPIVQQLGSSEEWGEVFMLIDEYEGAIVNLASSAVGELQALLGPPGSTPNVAAVTATASLRAAEVKRMLTELHTLHTRILGLSGTVGFMELTDPDHRDRLHTEVASMISVINHGHIGNRTDSSVHVGSVSQAGNVNIGSGVQTVTSTTVTVTAAEAAKALGRFSEQLEAEPVPPEVRERAQRQVAEMQEEIASPQPDKDYFESTLKRTVGILKQAGVVVSETTALGKALLPVVGWLGKTAAMLLI